MPLLSTNVRDLSESGSFRICQLLVGRRIDELHGNLHAIAAAGPVEGLTAERNEGRIADLGHTPCDVAEAAKLRSERAATEAT
jgi:hypothetical protein